MNIIQRPWRSERTKERRTSLLSKWSREMILSSVVKLSRNSTGRKSRGTEYAKVFNGSVSLGDHKHWKWYCWLTGSGNGQLAEHGSWRPYSPFRVVRSLTWSQWENFKVCLLLLLLLLLLFCNEEATWYFGRQLPAMWRRGKPGGGCFIDKGWKDGEEEQVSEKCKCESQPNTVVNSFAWRREEVVARVPGWRVGPFIKKRRSEEGDIKNKFRNMKWKVLIRQPAY